MNYYISSDIAVRGEGSWNFSGPLTYFVKNEISVYSYVQSAGILDFKNWGGVFNWNTWEISEHTIEEGYFKERAKSRFFLDELYIFYGEKGESFFSLRAGWINFVEGSGYIVDDFYPGLEISFFPFRNFPVYAGIYTYKVELEKLISSSSSIISGFITGYRFSGEESLNLSFTYLSERDDSMKKYLNETIWNFLRMSRESIMNYLTRKYTHERAWEIYNFLLVNENIKYAKADIFWMSANGNKILGDWEGELLFSLCFGKVNAGILTLDAQTQNEKEMKIGVLGYLLKFSVERKVEDFASVKGGALLMSGSSSPFKDLMNLREPRINAFLSFRPLLYDSAIFFQKSINTGLHTSEIQVAGLMGTGFIIPHIEVSFFPITKLELDLKGVFILSEKVPEAIKSSLIGEEINFNLLYKYKKFLSFLLEFDLFVPGDFIPGLSEPSFILLGGINWNFEFK